MKVTTDACIQGAWTPVLAGTKDVLDIGCGTGLLSLMLAQKKPDLLLTGLEIDITAANQAKENIAGSLWNDRIEIIAGDARAARFSTVYDLIITNPPFYQNSLLSENESKNFARHNNTLSNEDLLLLATRSLKNTGYLSIMLPLPEYKIFETFMQENGWKPFRKLMIRHKENAEVKRIVALFSRVVLPLTEDAIVIYNEDTHYNAEFIELMSPFYLNL
jgi:tRNA1Val (adenine37-N6)-methyltransferase